MTTSKNLAAGVLLALACQPLSALADDVPGSRKEATALWGQEGMEPVEVKGLDAAYARPGASLSAYTRILLPPVDVSFRRDWGRSTSASANSAVRPEDAEKIRAELATLVHEELAGALTAAGYAVVASPGEDVLEVRAQITNLYVTAPERTTAGRTRTYAVSAGEMTLVAELRDSVSGETAMRLYDHAEAREWSQLHWVTSSENRAEARRAAAAWAASLQRILDQARAATPP